MDRRHFISTLAAVSAVGLVTPFAFAGAASGMQVYRSPSCGCCGAWARHVQQAGIDVTIHGVEDLTRYKQRAGLPRRLWSCHTAFIGGYAIEGHVPVREIKRLLAERPKAKGLAVPGMPVGSPGMEMGDRRDPYKVILFDGTSEKVYAVYG